MTEEMLTYQVNDDSVTAISYGAETYPVLEGKGGRFVRLPNPAHWADYLIDAGFLTVAEEDTADGLHDGDKGKAGAQNRRKRRRRAARDAGDGGESSD